MLHRRHLLGTALGGSAALFGSRTTRASSSAMGEGLALHALNRLGYGPRPGDLAAVSVRSWEEHVEAQLQAREALPDKLQARLAALATRWQPLPARLVALRERDRQANLNPGGGGGEVLTRRDVVRESLQDAAEARLARALWSPNQLEERLVEFWFNHFNVFIGKGACRVIMGDYEAQAIRPHVLGRFRDLLGATAQHPAMLFYLDNWLSTRPGVATGEGRGGLNENYARELMELHTLGVHGGYTQADVTELARVFTGWTIRPQRGEFVFAPNRHDEGAKTWLGHSVPGRGQQQGLWALDQLAAHPATAQRVAFKLAQHFVADTPDAALVTATAQVFLKTDGDLRATTRALLLHPAARSESVWGQQFKTPYRFALSLLRATDTTVPAADGWQPVLQALRTLGQPLFGCVTPDGYKTTREAWLDPEALARRAEVAARLAQRVQPDPGTLLATLGRAIGPATRALVAKEPPRLQAALLLGSPDFQGA